MLGGRRAFSPHRLSVSVGPLEGQGYSEISGSGGTWILETQSLGFVSSHEISVLRRLFSEGGGGSTQGSRLLHSMASGDISNVQSKLILLMSGHYGVACSRGVQVQSLDTLLCHWSRWCLWMSSYHEAVEG